MKTDQSQIALPDGRRPVKTFEIFEQIITDRGSKYTVSGGLIHGREDIKSFLSQLKSDKSYAKATHNSYAARVEHQGQLWETKNDDGETGAGAVILRIMRKEDIRNAIIVVTRWFGGTKLMNDRFKHLQDATQYFITHAILQ